MAYTKREAVFLAICENQPITFTQLFKLLKQQGTVNSRRTLSKCLKRLIKDGKITKELACLHLDHPNVLNPPLTECRIVFGKNINGKFIPDKNSPKKLVYQPELPPQNLKVWIQKHNRLVFSNRKVYVLKYVTSINEDASLK
ncbi:MAG: hypothetical protein QXR63_03320 [Candidatus Bathyarchaeia archaeon]